VEVDHGVGELGLVADSAEWLQSDCFSVTTIDMKWGIGKHSSSNCIKTNWIFTFLSLVPDNWPLQPV
jgi:hypothetical protein